VILFSEGSFRLIQSNNSSTHHKSAIHPEKRLISISLGIGIHWSGVLYVCFYVLPTRTTQNDSCYYFTVHRFYCITFNADYDLAFTTQV